MKTQQSSSTQVQEDFNKKLQQVFANLKKSMQGSEQEKEAILKKRILKNFQDYKLEPHLFYCQRRNINGSQLDMSQILTNSLLIYGTDFMSEDDLEFYFNSHKVKVTLYDESHCAVLFESQEELMFAFSRALKNLAQSPTDLMNLMLTGPIAMLEWRELKGYKQVTIERKLYARYLTIFDNQAPLQTTRVLNTYNQVKRRFLDQHRVIQQKGQEKKKFDSDSRTSRSKHKKKKRYIKALIEPKDLFKYISPSKDSDSDSKQRERSRSRNKRSEHSSSKRQSKRDKSYFKMTKPLAHIVKITSPPQTRSFAYNPFLDHSLRINPNFHKPIPHKQPEEQSQLGSLCQHMTAMLEKHNLQQDSMYQKSNDGIDFRELQRDSYFK